MIKLLGKTPSAIDKMIQKNITNDVKCHMLYPSQYFETHYDNYKGRDQAEYKKNYERQKFDYLLYKQKGIELSYRCDWDR